MTDDLDIIIRADSTLPPFDADNAAIAEMQRRAADYRADEHNGNRLRIHLILRSQGLSDSLKRLPLDEALAANVELYTYTREDLWAMEMLGVNPKSNSRLDRSPVTADSPQHIHLVLVGNGSQAESLAILTALTAHFPNYCRDHSLRTRITMVADKHAQLHSFQQRYRNLLLHSYRRTVTVNADDVECHLMEPQYTGLRKEFVDVEWEFVEGTVGDAPIGYKLRQWSHNEGQQLTIAFCHEEDERNLSEALSLQGELKLDTPIWLSVKDATAVEFLRRSNPQSALVPFGMTDAVLPDMTDFIRMAQCVNFAYSKMRDTSEAERAQGMSDLSVALDPPSEETLQELWNNKRLTTPKRWSNLYNAFTLRSKMHSLGHPATAWGTLFAVSDKEVETMSEVEHNRWSVEELILGYRPTTEEEHQAVLKDISKKETLKQNMIHEDLRNYHELGSDDSGLSVKRYDAGLIRTLPLIVYSYNHLKTEQS